MLSIEHLNLHLPAGYEHRANSIVRLIAKELAGMPVSQSADIASLQVPEVRLHQGQSDRQAASAVAQAIHRQIGGVSRE